MKKQELRRPCTSRRGFGKALAAAIAGCSVASGQASDLRPENVDADAWVKLATRELPVHLTDTELADLKHDLQEGQKGLAKIREFGMEDGVEPAFLFRAT